MLERTIKEIGTLFISDTIHMVRKATTYPYHTEGPLPSLCKDFSVFIEMASRDSRETKHIMMSASSQDGAGTNKANIA